MRRLVLIAVLCVVPLTAFSHPGKTDRHGGHKCIKGCEDWGLLYGEYHLHDKYGKAIRISKKTSAPEPAVVQSAVTETPATPPLVTTNTQTVTVYRYVANVYEENVFVANPLLWLLLVLLLLLLILLKKRKKEEA